MQDAAAGEKRKYPFDEHDVQCSICKQLLYEPRSFPCNHVICLPCSLVMKKGQACPECKRPPRDNEIMPKNHLVARIVSACYPEEYEKRREEHELELWIEVKKRDLPTFSVAHFNIKRNDVLTILKKLDSLGLFLVANKVHVDQLETLFSDTCSFFTCALKNSQSFGYRLTPKLPSVHIVWKDELFFVSNTGTEWFKQ